MADDARWPRGAPPQRRAPRAAHAALGAASLCCGLRGVRAELRPDVIFKIEQNIGRAVLDEVAVCEARSTCEIAWLAQRLADSAAGAQNLFTLNPWGAGYDQEYCDTLRAAMSTDVTSLRDKCSPEGKWPPECSRMELMLRNRLQSDLWELGVACSALSPGPDKQYVPQCSKLATAMIAGRETLPSCHNITRPQCVANFCDLYDTFEWRMRPHQMQLEGATSPYATSFVLPGCEVLATYDYRPEECHLREDVNAFCDCLCEGFPSVQAQNGEDCQTDITRYLMFGRQRLDGLDLARDCEPELCKLLSSMRDSDNAYCGTLKLPSMQECGAMFLHKVEENCVWEQHSGENNILECLDGHRCNLDAEGWACCNDHIGRGRCPANTPVMCNTLCSGNTEYCCGELGSCTPRPCTPVLRPTPGYLAITSTMTSTTPPPGSGANIEEDSGIEIRIPAGAWIWALLIIPVCIGCCVLFVWLRYCRTPPDVIEPPCKVEENVDKLGAYNIVKPKPMVHDSALKRPVIEIVLDKLPNSRPLGIELLELKVVRVHQQGERYGWKVGDLIVEIAGVPITTFEELWERIQVERDRPPVRFMVERMGGDAIGEDERLAMREAEGHAEAERAKKRKSGKVAPAPVDEAIAGPTPKQAWGGAESPLAARGLASSLVGWERWLDRPGGDPAAAAAAAAAGGHGGGGSRGRGGGRGKGAGKAAAANLEGDDISPNGSRCSSPTARDASGAIARTAATTGFMRAFPLTPGARLLSTMSKKKTDPGASEVRMKTDAWGRAVLQVGGD